MRVLILATTLAVTVFAMPVSAAPVLMSADWAKDACTAWNNDPTLTDKLVESGWIKTDSGRGFKVMQLYRSDCGDQPSVEMRVSLKENKAMCVYGGAPETAKLEAGSDYVMKATTERWIEMGKGEYGPMAAMMFGRLGFEGPKLEAMMNMGPFASFLLLVGKVPSETDSCPAKQ
jgi:putative sterol carrier protein